MEPVVVGMRRRKRPKPGAYPVNFSPFVMAGPAGAISLSYRYAMTRVFPWVM